MHTTSLDLFKQVSLSYWSFSLYRNVQMYSLCFKLQLQMLLWESGRKVYVTLAGEPHKGRAHSSPQVQCKQIYGPLPRLSLLIPPVSLLLHIPLERMTEERAEQSVHLLNLSGGDSTDWGGREGESGRAGRRNYEIQPLFHGETPGRKDCMSLKSAREGGPPG